MSFDENLPPNVLPARKVPGFQPPAEPAKIVQLRPANTLNMATASSLKSGGSSKVLTNNHMTRGSSSGMSPPIRDGAGVDYRETKPVPSGAVAGMNSNAYSSHKLGSSSKRFSESEGEPLFKATARFVN